MIYNLEFRMGEEVDSMTYGGGAPVCYAALESLSI